MTPYSTELHEQLRRSLENPFTMHSDKETIRVLLDQIEQLQAELAAVKAENRWIPVEERSPEEIGRYEFLMIPTMAGEQHATIEAYDPAWGAISPLFTHWRPIVSPKGGEE